MIPGKPIVTTDYTRYFKRFGSSLECGFNACKDMNYREHFHCAVPMCKGKDFAKKEEMIRHSKWHQKMDEALKYGFRRVTPMDDCSDQFADCTHNKKQTHYHCIQSDGCDKVEQNIVRRSKIFSVTQKYFLGLHQHIRCPDALQLPSQGQRHSEGGIPPVPRRGGLRDGVLHVPRPEDNTLPLQQILVPVHLQEQSRYG